MNIYLISEYINRLRKSDIERFALKQGITLDKEEVDIFYSYIKANYKKMLYDNTIDTLEDIRSKVSPNTYSKVEGLYLMFKDKIDAFTKNIRGN